MLLIQVTVDFCRWDRHEFRLRDAMRRNDIQSRCRHWRWCAESVMTRLLPMQWHGLLPISSGV